MHVLALITARLGSTRLPRKMLRDLEGAPVLEHVVTNLLRSRRPDTFALATTVEPEDDELAAAAHGLGVGVVRGPTEDVIARWLQAAEELGADLVVNCDGDDVMCDAHHVDRIAEHHQRTGDDYITCAGLPFGAAPSGYSRGALERVCARKVESTTEGQARFFADPSVATHGEVPAPPEVRHDSARMTLDYPEDLDFFAAIVRELGMAPALAEVVALLRRRPEIVEINAGRQEEYWRRFNERYPAVELRAQ